MKVCAKCGSSLPDGAAFCISCGSTEFRAETMPNLNIPEEEKPKIEYDQYGRPIGQQPRQEEPFEMPHFADLSASANSYGGESLSEQLDQSQYLDGYQERKKAWGNTSGAQIPVIQPDSGFQQYGQQQYAQPQYGQQQYAQPQYGQPQQYAQPQYGQPQYAQPQYEQPQQYAQPQYEQPQQYAQPQYEQPQQYAQPQYEQPQQYAQPQYEQPQQYAQPQYEQPQQYAQPQYEQPQYEQPAPAPAPAAVEPPKPEPAVTEPEPAAEPEPEVKLPEPSTTIQTPMPDPDGPDPYESSKNFKFVRKEDDYDEEEGEEPEKKKEEAPKTLKGYIEKYQNTADHTRDYDVDIFKKNKKFAIIAVLGPTFWVPFVFNGDCQSTRFYGNQGLLVFILEILLGLFESIFTGIVNTAFFDTAAVSPVLLIIGIFLDLLLTAIFYAVPIFMIVTGIMNINAGKIKDLPFVGKLRLIH